MNYTRNILSSLLVILAATLSLTAQKVTDLKQISNFYHVPNSATHRLSAIQGIYGYEDLEYHYDGHNNLIRMDHYQTDTISKSKELVSYEKYLYNDKGQCWQRETYDYRKDWPDLVVSKRDIFVYNDKGQLTQYTRWYNLNTVASDTTLVEDRKISIQYTESGLPSKAHVKFLDPRNFSWYDSFDITLEYNDRGQLCKRTSIVDDKLYEAEEITFDAQGRYMVGLALTSENGLTEWIYSPDDKGNLVNTGTSDFPIDWTFVAGQKAEETYYPLPNLSGLLLDGLRNYTLREMPLLYNSSPEAVASSRGNDAEGEYDGGKFVYETNKPTYVEPVYTTERCTLSSGADSWTVSGTERAVQLYTLEGHCLQVVEPVAGVATISTATLPAGSYLIKAGAQTFKVVR